MARLSELVRREQRDLSAGVGDGPVESGTDLCSQPTISRLENLPGPVALKRMMAAMVELFCDSFEQVPRRIVLDIDDTEDRVHGEQVHQAGSLVAPDRLEAWWYPRE